MAVRFAADPLDDLPGVAHGFFGRRGGVSDGIYGSLNCGQSSGDDPEKVAANRARVAGTLGVEPEYLLSAFQVHSADVHVVTDGWDASGRPKVDGLVTRVRGVALGVLAADCGPVLFADAEAGVIGACHAGWRGAVAGVIGTTVEAMEGEGARRGRIRAVLGPTIAQKSYEVGPEFPAPFLAQDEGNARFFREAPREGHYLFDLPGYIVARLEALGVAEAGYTGHDTCAEADDFFSYRRNTKAGEKRYGRNISVIALPD